MILKSVDLNLIAFHSARNRLRPFVNYFKGIFYFYEQVSSCSKGSFKLLPILFNFQGPVLQNFGGFAVLTSVGQLIYYSVLGFACQALFGIFLNSFLCPACRPFRYGCGPAWGSSIMIPHSAHESQHLFSKNLRARPVSFGGPLFCPAAWSALSPYIM